MSKKLLLLALVASSVVSPVAHAMSVAAMGQVGSAIKWRETNRDMRMADVESYIMNVDVPSGDIDIGGIEACMQGKLAPYSNIQVMDNTGPSFKELMQKCVY